jgi:hypothetical protein
LYTPISKTSEHLAVKIFAHNAEGKITKPRGQKTVFHSPNRTKNPRENEEQGYFANFYDIMKIFHGITTTCILKFVIWSRYCPKLRGFP